MISLLPLFGDKTSHEAQQMTGDFLKVAEKRFAEVNENDNERINSAVP